MYLAVGLRDPPIPSENRLFDIDLKAAAPALDTKIENSALTYVEEKEEPWESSEVLCVDFCRFALEIRFAGLRDTESLTLPA